MYKWAKEAWVNGLRSGNIKSDPQHYASFNNNYGCALCVLANAVKLPET